MKGSLWGRLGVAAAALSAAGGAWIPAHAEESGRMVFTAGLVAEVEDADEPWAYVAWRATEVDLLFQTPVGVYAKPGAPADPGGYERVSLVDVQTEPALLSAIVGRAERLGESREELEERLDAVFQNLITNPDWGIGEKLSTVIQGAIADPVVQENLLVLAQGSPALSMALGRAYAGPLSELTTFEVRELDGGEPVRVFGRTTVDPANPVVLPAPGAPLDVTAVGPRGHLNVRLLWSQPGRLLQLMPLHKGFNVYRVEKDFAEAEGWNQEPPDFGNPGENFDDPDGIENGWDDVAEVVRANQLPVLANETLTEADVAEIAGTDPEERDEDRFFFTDDKDRTSPEEGFEDGEQYYYFVTAKDLLGQDGESSPGTLVTICNRLPPVTPEDLEVENVYEYEGGDGERFLRVRWRQNDENDPRAEAANYYVYRWDSVPEIHANAGDPQANLIAGPIPHDSSREFAEFDDVGQGAPTIEEDAGRTFWYTVRAEDDSVCGGNLSGNSAPAFGVLRDREGPGSPRGELEISCLLPGIVPLEDRPLPEGSASGPERVDLILGAERLHPEIAWVEFVMIVDQRLGGFERFGRVYFSDGDDTVEKTESFYVGSDAEFSRTIAARAGTHGGQVSGFAATGASLVSGYSTRVDFEADVEFVRGLRGDDCLTHTSRDPGVAEGEDDIQPVGGFIEIPEGTREWRLYRRVDEGPLTLIDQGDDDYEAATEISWEDDAMPASASTRICYYGQVFDEHGNAGPLVRLDCTEVKHSDLPTPILTSATPLEEDGEGRKNMRLRWFCPPAGVERFEVLLTPAGPAADVESASLAGPLSEDPLMIPGESGPEEHRIFQTLRVPGGFGEGAEFVADIAVEEGVEYEAVVRAAGPGAFAVDVQQEDGDGSGETRATGPLSNRIAFSWFEFDPAADPEETPWPQRPVPDAADLTELHASIEAGHLEIDDTRYLGIKLGEYRFEHDDFEDPITMRNVFPAGVEPEELLYPLGDLSEQNETAVPPELFPFVVYRVPVSGAISDLLEEPAPATFTQVSPRIGGIAYEEDFEFQFGHGTLVFNAVRDSRFVFEPVEEPGDSGPSHEIFFLDHHPFMGGTEYRYLLLNFGPDGEIARVLVSPAFSL